MPNPTPLRDDTSADQIRELAHQTHEAKRAHRLLALADVRDDLSRTETAPLGVLGIQTLRRQVLVFNADGPAIPLKNTALGLAGHVSEP